MVAQLNHELMSKGLAPMGWINPWIYANPQMFTDVTEGSNPYEKCDGFYASGRSPSRLSLFAFLLPNFAFFSPRCAAGWDPVTGMGTPIYPEM